MTREVEREVLRCVPGPGVAIAMRMRGPRISIHPEDVDLLLGLLAMQDESGAGHGFLVPAPMPTGRAPVIFDKDIQ